MHGSPPVVGSPVPVLVAETPPVVLSPVVLVLVLVLDVGSSPVVVGPSPVVGTSLALDEVEPLELLPESVVVVVLGSSAHAASAGAGPAIGQRLHIYRLPAQCPALVEQHGRTGTDVRP